MESFELTAYERLNILAFNFMLIVKIDKLYQKQEVDVPDLTVAAGINSPLADDILWPGTKFSPTISPGKNRLMAFIGLWSDSGLVGGTLRTAPTTTLASFGAWCIESQNLRPSPWSYKHPNRRESTAAPYCCPKVKNFATCEMFFFVSVLGIGR